MNNWTKKLVIALAVCGMTMGVSLSSAEAGGSGSRYRSVPGGVGANLHRSFMIKRAYRKAAKGQRVRRHVGIWQFGGFPKRSYRSYRSR